METNLVYTDEQYDDFDKILNSGIYYLHSIAQDYNGLTIINFDSKDEYCLVLYELVTQYCSIFNKTLYLDMPLFKYLWFKHKHKTNFKKANPKNDGCYLDAYQTMGNICRNVKLPIELTHDIYTAYYKKGK